MLYEVQGPILLIAPIQEVSFHSNNDETSLSLPKQKRKKKNDEAFHYQSSNFADTRWISII